MTAEINEFSVSGEMSWVVRQTGRQQVDCSRVVGQQQQKSDRRQCYLVTMYSGGILNSTWLFLEILFRGMGVLTPNTRRWLRPWACLKLTWSVETVPRCRRCTNLLRRPHLRQPQTAPGRQRRKDHRNGVEQDQPRRRPRALWGQV